MNTENQKTSYIIIMVIGIVSSTLLFTIGLISHWSGSSGFIFFTLAIALFLILFVLPIKSYFGIKSQEQETEKSVEIKTYDVLFQVDHAAEQKSNNTDSDIISVSPDADEKTNIDNELLHIPSISPDLSFHYTRRRLISNMPEISFTNVTKKLNLKNLFPLVFIDTETTGFQPSKHDIVEIGAIKFAYPFSPVSTFSTLINPQRHIPFEASAVNGITDEMLTDAPSFSEVVDSLANYIQGCNIAGHNLLFDLKFLFVSGLDLPSNVKYYDTLDIAKKTLIKEGQHQYDHHIGSYVEYEDYDVANYKLETLCDYYGINRKTKHRAVADAYATALVFRRLLYDKTDVYIPYPQVAADLLEEKKDVTLADSIKIETEQAPVEPTMIVEDVKATQKKPKQSTEKTTKRPAGRRIIQLDDDGNVLAQFDSIADAFRATGINQKSLRDAANGIQKHAGGYVWKFNDTNET